MVVFVDIGVSGDGRERERSGPMVVELERRGVSGIIQRGGRRQRLRDIAFVAEAELEIIDVSGEMGSELV